MLGKGWHNGSEPKEPTGYGIKIDLKDRARYFDKAWESVEVDMDGDTTTTVPLTPSFWRSCPELRSPEIGRWLLEQGAAPWHGDPPSLAVTPDGEQRFTVRVLKRHRFQ